MGLKWEAKGVGSKGVGPKGVGTRGVAGEMGGSQRGWGRKVSGANGAGGESGPFFAFPSRSRSPHRSSKSPRENSKVRLVDMGFGGSMVDMVSVGFSLPP